MLVLVTGGLVGIDDIEKLDSHRFITDLHRYSKMVVLYYPKNNRQIKPREKQ